MIITLSSIIIPTIIILIGAPLCWWVIGIIAVILFNFVYGCDHLINFENDEDTRLIKLGAVGLLMVILIFISDGVDKLFQSISKIKIKNPLRKK